MKCVWIKLSVLTIISWIGTDIKVYASQDSTKMNVYFISGLGADKRLFDKLMIDSAFAVKHIEWIRPQRKETISAYAARLVSQIDTTKPFQLVGLSFGGMIAQEMNTIIKPEHTILISTLSTGRPMDKFYRILINGALASPLVIWMLKKPIKFTYNLFGAHTPEEKKLLTVVLKDMNNRFVRWAASQLISWKHAARIPNSFQIHGSADRIIRLEWVQPDRIISGGEHLMVYTKAAEISPILNQELLKFYKVN